MDKKVVFITGASRGIGAATTRKFVAEGWMVAGFYKETRMQNTEYCKYYQVNVSDWEDVRRSFGEAFDEWGRIDCMVNNAGTVTDKTLKDYTVRDIEKEVGVNLLGPLYFTKLAAEKMEGGSIVNISSTAAQAWSYDAVYGATKGGILSFTKSMAVELAPKIRVNCVAPGLANTDMGHFGWTSEEYKQRVAAIPLGRIAEPEDVANGIYFLASDQASYITGACLDINGGYVLR